MSVKFIRDRAGRWPVRLMCRVLEVSASGCYGWRSRPESARTVSNRAPLADVRRLHAERHGRHGSPGMHAALRAEGGTASRGRVARLMRRHGIRALAPFGTSLRDALSGGGSPVQTVHDRQPPLSADRAEPAEPGVRRRGAEPRPAFRRMRAFVCRLRARRYHLHRDPPPDRASRSDVPGGGEGWAHLAAALDLATRKIVGPLSEIVKRSPAAGRADDGRAATKTGGRPHPPFGSRQPIRIQGIRQAAHCNESETIDEPDGLPLR